MGTVTPYDNVRFSLAVTVRSALSSASASSPSAQVDATRPDRNQSELPASAGTRSTRYSSQSSRSTAGHHAGA
jgi:hypothetical protein